MGIKNTVCACCGTTGNCASNPIIINHITIQSCLADNSGVVFQIVDSVGNTQTCTSVNSGPVGACPTAINVVNSGIVTVSVISMPSCWTLPLPAPQSVNASCGQVLSFSFGATNVLHWSTTLFTIDPSTGNCDSSPISGTLSCSSGGGGIGAWTGTWGGGPFGGGAIGVTYLGSNNWQMSLNTTGIGACVLTATGTPTCPISLSFTPCTVPPGFTACCTGSAYPGPLFPVGSCGVTVGLQFPISVTS
jgi:hypothetical protein